MLIGGVVNFSAFRC